MKGHQIIFGDLAGREAAALLVDGVLEDLLVTPPDAFALPGAIYRARAEHPLKGLGGIFVSWPGGRGFLRDAKGVNPGMHLLVQVTGFAEPGKAPPVTRRILFKSRYCILTPNAPGINISRGIRDEKCRESLELLAHDAGIPEGIGAILRSASELADDGAVSTDLAQTADLAQSILGDQGKDTEMLLDGPGARLIAWRDWPATEAFTDEKDAFAKQGVLDEVDALVKCAEALSGSASFTVEPTRALVAVDVNSGADGSPAAGLKTSVAAARALPRALRLRGLGGQITIDFAPFPKKDRRQVESALRTAFRADPIETSLVGWTPLGHFELQRKRERLPLSECLK